MIEAAPELRVPVPRLIPVLVKKVTVPVGVPSPVVSETIAVSAIDWSANGVVFEAETVTDAVAVVTTWLIAVDVLAV